jgi:hypothetical protein
MNLPASNNNNNTILVLYLFTNRPEWRVAKYRVSPNKNKKTTAVRQEQEQN